MVAASAVVEGSAAVAEEDLAALAVVEASAAAAAVPTGKQQERVTGWQPKAR